MLRPTIYLVHIVFILFCVPQLASCSDNNELKEVTYTNPEPGVFFTDWLILGPFAVSEEADPSEEIQYKSFDSELFSIKDSSPESFLKTQTFNGHQYEWRHYESPNNIIDFNATYGDTNYVFAYAYARVDLDEAQDMLIGIGSDDAIKVWVNGTEVHNHFTARAVTPDEDLIEISLNKGANFILVKVQDMAMEWGFCMRPLGKESVSEKLYEAAGRGNIDDINLLFKYNPDLNYKSPGGLTVVQNAMVKGRKEVVDLLTEKGVDSNLSFPGLEEYIDLSIKGSMEGETPAFVVLVSKNGNIEFKEAYGFANLEEKVKASTTTKFRIGSITKQFIGAAIIKLQEEGKLNFEDKLTKFIPDYPRGDEVTIHHLLTHTSGIQSFTNRSGFFNGVTEPVESKSLVDSMKTWEFNFNPGEELRYNNSGYYLLGEIIEIVSGKWYGDYLNDAFFTPLNMLNTGVYSNQTPPENEAIGYTLEEGKIVPSLNWDMSWAGGAGSLYSTVEDLYLWNEALFNGKVLSQESLNAAHTSVILNDGSKPEMMSYGYGWGINNKRGAKEIAHGGGLHGFISYLTRYPEEKITIVTLTNTLPTMNYLNPTIKANEIAEYMLWENLEPQESYSALSEIDTEILADYVGRYDYGNAMILTITAEEGKLYAQMSGQPRFEMFPSGKDEFFWKVVEAKITFVRNENGTVIHGIHSQGGNELKVPKMEDLKVLEIIPDDIAPYIGKYKFDEGFYLEVSINDRNQLFIQATGQDKIEVFRVSEDTYQPKIINLNMRFYIQNGNATMDYKQGTFQKTISKE